MKKQNSDHSHDHEGHSHDVKGLPENKLWLAFILTGTFMLIEFFGGLMTKSLALVSDAMHMMTDSFALLLAIMAIKLGKKAADKFRTYGYERFEIIAAIINAMILFLVAFYILYEAYLRFGEPVEIASTGMLIVAFAGLIINLISMIILKSGKDESLNIKGAYLEVWADMLGSVGVIVGALIIWAFDWLWVDSVIAVLIGFMVFPRTYALLKEAINLILQGVPKGLTYDEIKETILNEDGVVSCHDLHIWAVTQSKPIMTGHIVYEDGTDPERLRNILEEKLKDLFHLEHTTLQMEKNRDCLTTGICFD